MNLKKEFLKFQAKTSPYPIGIEIKKAKGTYIIDTNNNYYLDFIAGVSVCNLGHSNPKIIKAIEKQIKDYMHVMVYGEFIQKPAVRFAKELASKVSSNLKVTYLTNSGTEAIEGALKLAKRYTGKKEIIAAKKSYHGSTQGALSVLGVNKQKKNYKPLLPKIKFIDFNDFDQISKINYKTAAVILESIQGGAGFILPKKNYLNKIKKRCEEVGSLLILDEIQPGFGRTGKLYGFQHYNLEPDILVIGKAFGGGLPIGAFCSSNIIMNSLSENPKLGHITTFGGNPVVASAALAALKELYNSNLMEEINFKEHLFRTYLKHPKIEKINGKGLMLAIIFKTEKDVNKIVAECLKKGLLVFWLLWEKRAIRITPPLTISKTEIKKGCNIILSVLNNL